MRKTQRWAPNVPGAPNWAASTADQAEWNGRFIKILERDYKALDPTICAILSNERLSKRCATGIRSYLDPGVTAWLYGERKARGATFKKRLETAIAGIKAAIEHYRDRGNQDEVIHLGSLLIELSGDLGRSQQAFATKRHGRDRAHSTLIECQALLEFELRRNITNATLANLVNAGLEVNGDGAADLITEESIRKNLAEFKRNNPHWRSSIAAFSSSIRVSPETK